MSAELTMEPGVNRAHSFYATAVVVLAGLFVVTAAVTLVVLTGDAGKGAWGVFMASAIYMLGLSQLGIVWVAILRICNAKWSRPLHRLGEVMTMASLPFAFVGLALVYVYGRDDLLSWIAEPEIWHRSPWLDERVLLWRHLVSQVIFYGVAIWYFYLSLLPDVTEVAARSGPRWRRRLYRWLLARRNTSDLAAMQEQAYRYAPWMILAYALPNTFIGWDFGMMLWPYYHSTVFTMYFMQGSLFGGTGLMLLLFVLLSRVVDVSGHFDPRVHVKNIGIMLTGFTLLWLYLFWAQFFVTWFGNLPHEYRPLWAQMYGHYAPFFWAQILCIIGIPMAALIFARVKRTLWPMLLLAVVMNIGVWINRYLMVVPALLPDHRLFAAPAELALALSPLLGYLTLLMLMFSAFPMLSRWELQAVSSGTRPGH